MGHEARFRRHARIGYYLFRIFRPRLFSKRMALLSPATGSLIWLRGWPSCRPLEQMDPQSLRGPLTRALSPSRIEPRYFNFVFACARIDGTDSIPRLPRETATESFSPWDVTLNGTLDVHSNDTYPRRLFQ